MKKIVPFSFYFLIFAAVAAHRPYLVLYYQSLDFTGAQIGLLVGIAPLITIFALPLFTGLADTTNKHGLILSVALLIVIGTVALLPFINNFVLLLIVITLSTVLFSPILPLAASASMYMLGDQRELFGRIRLGGTIGFSIASTVIGAIVQDNGLRIAFWSAAVFLFIAFLVSQKLEHGAEETRKSPDWKQAGQLLKNPRFILFLLIGLSSGISGTTLSTYLFPYMRELGAGESMMGLALTIGTLVEVPALFFVSYFLRRFGAYPIILFSMGMIGVRFLLLTISATPTVVLFIQLLNGLNHPLLNVAGVTYADQQAPDGFRATAQGLFNVAGGGVGSAIGGFIGGLLFDGIGAKGMYLTFGLFVLLVLVFVLIVGRMLPKEQPVIPATKTV